MKQETGLREVLLDHEDLANLWWALDVFLTVRADLELLRGERFRAFLVRLFKGTPWLDQQGVDALGRDPWWQIAEDRRAAEAGRGWKAYKDEMRNAEAREAQAAQRFAARLQALEAENALVVGERARAFRAVEILQERLRTAGLPAEVDLLP